MLKETARDEVACIKMVRSKVLILLLGPYSTWILTLSVYRLSQWWTVGLHPRSIFSIPTSSNGTTDEKRWQTTA